MRVLMLSWEFPPNVAGGLGRHVAELAPVLAQQDVEIHLVTPEFTRQGLPVETEDCLSVHRVYVKVDANSDIYERAVAANETLERYAHQLREKVGFYHLIHTHDWLTSFAAIALSNAWNRPLVATIHATERGRVRGHITSHLQWSIDNAERNLIYAAHQVIVCSRYMFNEVQYFFHAVADKLEIVPNGVNVDHLHDGYNPGDLELFRARYAAPDEPIVFSIARLVYEKGIHLLVRAAPRILAEFPQARIVIAGRGPEADNLEQQVRQLGVADRVSFIGFISDHERNHLYEVATCAVFPSLYEPFGIVALEAMALGCPVVVSDVGGLSEVVTHTETGVTVLPDNPDSVAWGVLHTLMHPDWAKQYALKARENVDLCFNWPRVARLTRGVYERMLGHHVVPEGELETQFDSTC